MRETITTCYCDRCGKNIEDRNEYGYSTCPDTVIEIFRGVKWEYVDLCDKCKKSFKTWFGMGKVFSKAGLDDFICDCYEQPAESDG